MHINATDKIAGIPILAVRKFMQANRNYIYPAHNVARTLKITQEQALELLAELERQGFVVQCPPREQEEPRWEHTVHGNALANASAARPATRQTADRIFTEFMQRVHTVNQDPYYLYKVSRVTLFGSYLSNAPTVNDIDLVIELERKEQDLARHNQLAEERSEEAANAGVHFANFVIQIAWAEHETMLFLKSRSRLLSFHPEFDSIYQTVDHKIVFPD